jgi:hypothetical protein
VPRHTECACYIAADFALLLGWRFAAWRFAADPAIVAEILNTESYEPSMPTPARLESVIERLRRTRIYTRQFLAGLTGDEWFWTPPTYTTHVAWQVGHIAVAEYNLCLRRLRGRTADDERLIPEAFIEAFKLGSMPVAGASNNPPLAEIQRVFDGVHEQVLSELPLVDNAELDTPLEQPHPAFKTKLGAIEYSPHHELVHAGQIAMLRRLMGKPPIR